MANLRSSIRKVREVPMPALWSALFRAYTLPSCGPMDSSVRATRISSIAMQEVSRHHDRRDPWLAAAAGLTVFFLHSCRPAATTRFARRAPRLSRGGRIGATRGGARPVRAADGASDRGLGGALRRTGRASGRRGVRGTRRVDGCVEPRIFGEQADAMVAIVVKETVQGGGWVCGQSSACRSSLALW